MQEHSSSTNIIIASRQVIIHGLTLMVLFFSPGISSAQEHLVPLGSNYTIRAFLQKNNPTGFRIQSSVTDTVTLPFIDDFARPGIYPFDSLWMDNDAFINSTFCDRPVTIGVATLDGLDAYGRPHDSLATADAIADYLTSQPIDLGGLQGDTSVWLSFYYQAQGLGDIPEVGDSLVVQFRDTAGTWNHVWSIPGRSDTVFQRVSIHVNDPVYLYKGFQFRFYNIATVNGNRDHWNLDYVILNKNTLPNDSIRDNGFINVRPSLLNEFTSMPYNHYKGLASPASAMVSSISDTVRNINYGITSLNYVATISDENGNSLFNSFPGVNQSGSSGSLLVFDTNLGGFSYPVTIPKDSTGFLVKTYFAQPGFQSNANNDTIRYTQTFENYYSYDDGSAEIGYGVTGNTDVRVAYRFDVKQTDTLRGVQIYFNPVGLNVHNKLFQLAYWDQLSVSGNSDHLVYKLINQKPANVDSLNEFATYLFDTLLVVPPGPAYVGFFQNEPGTIYGLGLDRNTDSHANMFYHLDGFWYQSTINGSWMIRPLFGDTIRTATVGIDELASVPVFDIFPNPACDHFTVRFQDEISSPRILKLSDITGREISSWVVKNNSCFVDVGNLGRGIYLVTIINANTGVEAVRKLLLQ